MTSIRPFGRKPKAAEPTEAVVFRNTVKQSRAQCYSSDYYKSRGSAELCTDFSRLDEPQPFQPCSAYKPNCNKKRSKRRAIKEFRAHTRHNSREANQSSAARNFNGSATGGKTTTHESVNLSHAMESATIVGLRSRTVMCEPLNSLVTSMNFNLSESNSRELLNSKLMLHDNAMTLTILEDIEMLEGKLKRLRTENEKMRVICQLRQLCHQQHQRLEELGEMEEAMSTAQTAKATSKAH